MFIKLFGKRNRFRYAIIDKEDFDLVSKYRWHTDKDGYAVSAFVKNGVRTTLKMHRLIMSPSSDMTVHHKNHDLVDNQKKNLIICTQRNNSRDRDKIPNRTSEFKGVTKLKRKHIELWSAGIKVDYQFIHLGNFTNEKDAAKAYDIAALKYFQEFSKLNFPEFDYKSYIPKPYEPEYHSKFNGVTWHKRHEKWMVNIKVGDKTLWLGYFDDEIEAAKHRDKYVIDNKLNKKLNFPGQ